MRHADFLRRVLSLLAILMLVFSLGLIGCDDDNDDDTEEASPDNLESQAFDFPAGNAFGIPEGQAFTLSIGNFINQVGAFTVTSGTSSATGGVTINSCDFDVVSSTFATGTGPQEGDMFVFDPCQVDSDGRLILTDEDGNEITSLPGEETGTTGSTGG